MLSTAFVKSLFKRLPVLEKVMRDDDGDDDYVSIPVCKILDDTLHAPPSEPFDLELSSLWYQ